MVEVENELWQSFELKSLTLSATSQHNKPVAVRNRGLEKKIIMLILDAMGQHSSLAVWSTSRGQEKHNTRNNGTNKAMPEANNC